MKKNLTELVFIIDRSGSMAGLVEDTIGGFNSMLEKQKKLEGEALVSTVLFSSSSKVIHDRLPITEVASMTEEDYQPCGSTALLDAIGQAIHHIGNVHKYARDEDRPEHTMFVITTDGMENASRSYTSEQVKKMIRRQEEKYGWEFLFVAANIDAVETAEHIGIRRERASNYSASPEGTRILYDSVDFAVRSMRCNSTIDDDWKKGLEGDPTTTKKVEKKSSNKKIVYIEPLDYFPKEIRKKYKLGEFAEKDEVAEQKNLDKKFDNV